MAKGKVRAKKSTNKKPKENIPPVERQKLVLLVHGIMSTGFWTATMAPHFQSLGWKVVPIGYSVVDVLRFLYWRRRPIVDEVLQKVSHAISNNHHHEVTIVAHSFGTYLVSQILEKDIDIKVTRLIMCGGVVPRNFNWNKVAILNAQGPSREIQLVNEHSGKDVWPVLARHVTFGYGDVGTFGCQQPIVTDRRHDMPHSGYLQQSFAEKYWVPAIHNGEVVVGTPDAKGRTPIVALNFLPTRLIGLILTMLCAYAILHIEDMARYKVYGEFALPRDSTIVPQISGSLRGSDTSAPVYTAQTEVTSYNLFSARKLSKLTIKIKNRLPIECGEPQGPITRRNNPNDEVSAPSRTEANATSGGPKIPMPSPLFTTTYDIDLGGAYYRYGLAKLQVKYGYTRKPSRAVASDWLEVGVGGKLNPTGLQVVSIQHSEDGSCLDEKFADLVRSRKDTDEYVSFLKKKLKADETWLSWAAGFFPAFAQEPGAPQPTEAAGFFPAFAQEPGAPQPTEQELIRLFYSENDGEKALAIEIATRKPEIFGPLVRKIVNEERSNFGALEIAIRAARNAKPAPIALDTAVVTELSYINDELVRDAVRSYLRSPGVVSDDLAKQFFGVSFENRVKALRNKPVTGRNYNRDYLLLIAARDIHYNLGLEKLDKHIEMLRVGRPTSFEMVRAAFQNGIATEALAQNELQRVPLAKNRYGLALAILEDTVNREALSDQNAKDVVSYLIEARAEKRPIKSPSQIKEQFEIFLRAVGDLSRDIYPWPEHIRQAQTCIENTSHSCLADGLAAE